MPYNKPFAEKIITNEICEYGCQNIANYKFRSGKHCCSKHFNSCPGKRKQFSKRTDHKETARKSLETRTRLGITKSSQIKGSKTRRESGHYDRLAKKMKQHWKEHPWDNNTNCPILKYKDTEIVYQGTYEFEFLALLEFQNGLDWVTQNVSRGPSLYYLDENNEKRLYISDFQISNTIYEIKSSWTWDKHGQDSILRERNERKLNACISAGYQVKLVLNGEQINYGST